MNVNSTISPVFETPYERAGVLTPGLPILPHGTERHPIPGGGSRAVPVYKGDEISVLDRDGAATRRVGVFYTRRQVRRWHVGAGRRWGGLMG